jgi:paraquat-inducible protein B
VIRIEPERVAGSSMSQEDFKEQMRIWIKRGVTASVESSNLITGQLKVSLDNTGTPIERVESFGPYPVIPARQGGFAGITAKVDGILNKIDQLPLESLVVNTRDAMSSIEQTMGAADDAVIQLQTTLSKLTQTLIEAEQAFEGVQPGGEVYLSLQQTLKEMRTTMEGLQPNASGYVTMETTLQKWQELMDKLKPIMARINNQPNALLFGSVREADEEPQAAGDEQ